MLNQTGSRYPITTAVSPYEALFKLCQGRFKTLSDCRRKFVAASKVLEHMKVSIRNSLIGLTDAAITKAILNWLDAVENRVMKKFLADRFLSGADKKGFGEVYIHLENGFTSSRDMWPEDITAAYNLLESWQHTTKSASNPPSAGLSFAQEGNAISARGESTT